MAQIRLTSYVSCKVEIFHTRNIQDIISFKAVVVFEITFQSTPQLFHFLQLTNTISFYMLGFYLCIRFLGRNALKCPSLQKLQLSFATCVTFVEDAREITGMLTQYCVSIYYLKEDFTCFTADESPSEKAKYVSIKNLHFLKDSVC